MTFKNALGYLIMFAVAALIFTVVALKHGVVQTAIMFGLSIGITALLVFGINLSLDTRR